MNESSLLKALIESLRCLPGVGARTAQRMAFHLLENDRRSGERLAEVMGRAMREIKQCSRCRTLTEHDTCRICANPARQATLLCVVEHPSDVVAVEQATGYRGYYFVLGGRLSPLDGIGPEDIGLDLLEARLDEGEVQELILATNPPPNAIFRHHGLRTACRWAANWNTSIAAHFRTPLKDGENTHERLLILPHCGR